MPVTVQCSVNAGAGTGPVTNGASIREGKRLVPAGRILNGELSKLSDIHGVWEQA